MGNIAAYNSLAKKSSVHALAKSLRHQQPPTQFFYIPVSSDLARFKTSGFGKNLN